MNIEFEKQWESLVNSELDIISDIQQSMQPVKLEVASAPQLNIFEESLAQLQLQASPQLVHTLCQQMQEIKKQFPETALKVDHCLPVLKKNPTMSDILAICYILNGGVLLKHMLSDNDDEDIQPLLARISEVDDEFDDEFLKQLDWNMFKIKD